MPATSSAPGSYSQTAQARGAKKVIRRATRSVAADTAQAVTFGAGTAVSTQPVARATSLGVSQPSAATIQQARKARRIQQRERAQRRETKQRVRQIERVIKPDPEKASRQLTAKTAKLADRIEAHTNVDVPRPKVELGDSKSGIGVKPRLAKQLLKGSNKGKTAMAKELLSLPAPQKPKQAPRPERKAARRQAVQSIPDIGNARQVAPLVRRQAKKHGLEPSVLMSQIQHESNFDPSAVSPAGAQGETQFMPGTAPGYGVKFSTSPKAVRSQIKGQAKFMGELVQSKGNISDALAAYNAGPAAPPEAAGTYPQDILRDAAQYAALDKGKVSSKPVPKKTVTRFEAIVDEAKKIDSAQLPYSLGAGHVSGKVPGPSKTTYDCSSAVSRVLQAAGYDTGGGAQVSGWYENFGKPGPGAVTIYANSEHVFMRIGNRYWGTSHANPQGGAGFIPTSYEQGEAESGKYVVRHVPGLGQDIARRMGIRLSPGGQPGLSLSPSQTSATITDGVIRDTPGSSSKPIKLDPSTVRAKAKRRKARQQEGRQRSKFIRSLIANPPSESTSSPSAPESDYDAYLNRKASLSL